MNDTDDELEEEAGFLAGLSPDIPWHITAFHPDYRMRDRPRTPVEDLLRARDIGLRAGLRYVYLGNVDQPGSQTTRCPSCRRSLVERDGWFVTPRWERAGWCACGTRIPGLWTRDRPAG